MTFEPGQQPQAPAPQPGPAPAGRPPTQPPTQQPVVPSFIPPSVAAAAATPGSKSRVSAGTVAFVVAIVVAAAGLGFAGGRLTAPQVTARGAFAGGFGNGNGTANANGGAGRAGGFGAFAAGSISVTGQVTAIADGSMTIQTSTGQSVTVALPSTVTYHAQTGAAASDVTVGSNVQLTVSRPNGFRGGAEASGAPAPSAGAFQLSASDVTVLGK